MNNHLFGVRKTPCARSKLNWPVHTFQRDAPEMNLPDADKEQVFSSLNNLYFAGILNEKHTGC